MSIKDCDSHKLSYHPCEVAAWKASSFSPPLHAEIGITNRCNHKCKFCTLDWITHGVDSIDKDVMMATLKEMSEMGVKSIYYAGEGEPTLHKNLSDFVEYGKKLGISQAISTNGSKFDRELAEKLVPHLSWIRFSVDAATPQIYSEIHGVKGEEINNVLKNIADCVEVKKQTGSSIEIGIQFILMPENICDVEQLATMVKEIGVDNFQVKPAHSHPKSSYAPSIYKFSQESIKKNLEAMEDDKFSVVVRVKSMERIIQPRNYKECHGFHFYAIIDAKGDVVPCNVFYSNPEFIYGNLYDASFKQIWFGDRRKGIIDKITSKCFEMCGDYRCRLDVINRYLERVKNPEKNDEFI